MLVGSDHVCCVFLQAQKFVGMKDQLAEVCVAKIRDAEGPEEAARFGRTLARQRPDLVLTTDSSEFAE